MLYRVASVPPAPLLPALQRAVLEVRGLAIIAHGAGSGRDSYHTRYIAGRLRLSGYATLRLDLLTPAEYVSGVARPYPRDSRRHVHGRGRRE